MNDVPRLLTVPEVAERTRVTLQTVRNWIAAGRVRGVRTGRRWRVLAEDVDAMLADLQSPPRKATAPQAPAGAWGMRDADELLDGPSDLPTSIWDEGATPRLRDATAGMGDR
jgi:excisionase family DNA binding protein